MMLRTRKATLRTSNVVAPWIASYMHTCRVMGNKAVHNRNTEPPYYDRLHGSDLIVVMSAVHALAKFSTHKKSLSLSEDD